VRPLRVITPQRLELTLINNLTVKQPKLLEGIFSPTRSRLINEVHPCDSLRSPEPLHLLRNDNSLAFNLSSLVRVCGDDSAAQGWLAGVRVVDLGAVSDQEFRF
jgi:hypothetical protein